jgi:hypothetical protein
MFVVFKNVQFWCEFGEIPLLWFWWDYWCCGFKFKLIMYLSRVCPETTGGLPGLCFSHFW